MKAHLLAFVMLGSIFCYGQEPTWSNCTPYAEENNSSMTSSLVTSVESVIRPSTESWTGDLRDLKIAIDFGNDLYLKLNSDNDLAKWYAYNLINEASKVTMREFNVTLSLVFIDVRETPENYGNPGDFTNYWATNHGSVERDYTHYITSASGGSAGLINTSCSSSSNYALSYEFTESTMMDLGNIPPQVFLHEMGHNMGGKHPHEEIGQAASCMLGEGKTGDIMSYCDKRDLKYLHTQNDTRFQTKLQCYDAIINAPTQVELEEPSIKSTSPMLFWKPSPGSTSYTIEISTETDFSSIMMVEELSLPVFHAYNLVNGEQYYWRVKAGNPNGQSSWSTVSNFIVDTPAIFPALISPRQNAKGVQEDELELMWGEIPSASLYQVQVSYISDINNFNNPLIDETVSTTSLDISSTLSQTNDWATTGRHNIFVWRVREQGGIWSPVYAFKPAPDPTTIVYPDNESELAVSNISLSWKSNFRETRYQGPGNSQDYDGRVLMHVQLATDPEFLNIVYNHLDSSKLATEIRTGNTAIEQSMTLPMELEVATQYFWRVRVGIDENTTGWPTEMPNWTSSTFTTTGLVLSVPEESALESIKIFPNPSNGTIHLTGKGVGGYVIYDLLGKEVKSEKNLESSTLYSITNLSKGMYFIQLHNEKGHAVVKKVIVR